MFTFESVTEKNFPVVTGLFDETQDDWVTTPTEDWFQKLQSTQSTSAVIFYKETNPLGYIQFEEEAEDVYSLAIFITKEYRGQGVGPTVLQDFIQKRPANERYRAYISDNDFLGTSAFVKAGFERTGPAADPGFSQYELN